MSLKRLLPVVILSVAMLWAVSLIAHPAEASPELLPPAAPLVDAPWNTNVRVNSAALAGPMPRRHVALAVISSTGKLYGIWEDERNGDPDVYLSQSSDGGASWRYTTRINHDVPGNNQIKPDVAVNLSGTLHAVWLDSRSGINAVYYATSTDGRTWSEEVRINEVATATADYPSIAVWGTKVCATWVDNRYGPRADTFIRCSLNSGTSWSATERISNDTPGQYAHAKTDVTLDSSGNPHVVWVNHWGEIYYAREIGRDWVNSRLDTSFTNWCDAPAIALRGNSVYVAWQARYTGGEMRVNARYSTDNGSTWSASDTQVNDVAYNSTIAGPTLVAGPRNMWVTWATYTGAASFLYADRGGSTWGADEVIVSATVPFTQSLNAVAAAGTLTQVVVAAIDPASESISLWTHNDVSWTSGGVVNNTGAASQYAPALGVGSSGNLYAVWNDNRSTEAGLYVAQSSDGGQNWSTNYPVSGSGSAEIPALAVSGTQTLHLAWQGADRNYWWIKYNSSTDGGQTWGTTKVITQVLLESKLTSRLASFAVTDEHPDIASYGNNVYVIGGGFHLYKSSDGGNTWNATQLFTQVNSIPVMATMPTVVTNEEGYIYLAWVNGGNRVCYARSINEGVTWGQQYCSSIYNGSAHPQIALEPSIPTRVHLVWSFTQSGVEQIGHTVSPDYGWSWETPQRIDDSSGDALFPAIASVADGVVYVAWQDNHGTGDDIYWIRSTDGGATWSLSARVNDDPVTSLWPQQRPILAANATYSTTRIWAAWQDFRNINWDIMSASLMDSCAVPLTAAGIQGNSTVEVGEALSLFGVITPANATTPIWYRWEEEHHNIQDVPTATFRWTEAGHYTPTLYVGNCSAPVMTRKPVLVPCYNPISAVSITGTTSVQANTLITLTALITHGRDLPVHITWQPEPLAGQDELSAQYLLKTPGTNHITATAYNCSGDWGVARDTHAVSVHDYYSPEWSNFQPTGWYTQPPTSRIIPFSIIAQDLQSGLDVSTAQVAFSGDAGVTWTAWEPITCPGSDGTNDPQTISGSHYFPDDSGTNHRNRVRFNISDMGGRDSTVTYYLDIDAVPPTNPTYVYVAKPIGAWDNTVNPSMIWYTGSDASSGIACYLAGWSNSPNALPNNSTPGFFCGEPGVETTRWIPDDGTNWYLHVRTKDYAGHWATSTLHSGPYWLDTGWPTTPTLVSTNPATGWTNDQTVQVMWGPATDNVSGIAGYSYQWMTAATSGWPDDITDTVNLAGSNYYITSPGLPDYDPALYNSHFFHVRGVDGAGNGGRQLIVGPFYVDTAAPLTPTLWTSSPPVNQWTNRDVITVTWHRPDDVHEAGVNAYSFDWRVDWSVDTTPDLTTTNDSITWVSGPPDDGHYYFNVRARDQAGNWGPQGHFGPYLVDWTPPTAPNIYFTSPQTGTPSLDTTIDVYWDRPPEPGGSGVYAYSFLWDRAATTVPDEISELDSSEPYIIHTSDPLPASTGYYFHVRAKDHAGNWGPASHVGPFNISIPAALFASHGSGAPGSDVMLTGLAFAPNITASIYFTSSNDWSQPQYVRTSAEGTFQTLYMVPPNANPGKHGFVALDNERMASDSFTVIQGMGLTAKPDVLARGQRLYVTTTQLSPATGHLVVESSAGHLWGPTALNGNQSKNINLLISNSTLSNTYQLTVTNRINGIAVQRALDWFRIITPTPIITPTHPPILWMYAYDGNRGKYMYLHRAYSDYADLSARAPCSVTQSLSGVWGDDGECVAVNHSFRWKTPDGNYPVCQQPYSDNPSSSYWELTEMTWHEHQSLVFEPNGNAYDGHDNGNGIQIYDGWYDATADPDLPDWNLECEMPHGQYELCLHVTGRADKGGEFLTTVLDRDLICWPFSVTPPSPFIAPYYLKDQATGHTIPASANPQIRLSGTTVGSWDETHPLPVDQTFTPDATGRITATLPEGSYRYTAFACGYEIDRGRVSGRGQLPVSTKVLTPTHFKGPAVLGVEASQQTYLTPYGKIGPFMSFQGAPDQPNEVPITFTIKFDSNMEVINSVRVNLPTLPPLQAQPIPGKPDQWWVKLNMNTLPPGDLMMEVQATGRYSVTGGCGDVSTPEPGPIFKVPIVMAKAPTWATTTSSWVQKDELSYRNGVYTLRGSFNKGNLGLPLGDELSISLPYLGTIENTIDANVFVTETFSSRDGSWNAFADFVGEATVMCLPGLTGEGCRNVKSMKLEALPQTGLVNSAAAPSFPTQYNGPTTPLFEPIEFGPWTVYQGMIASYWGVINVNLSINFGVETYATVTPGIKDNFEPAITLTPGAVLNGNISLWVDILLGIASAGVDGSPSLCLSLPVNVDGSGARADGVNVGFKLNGRVWVEALFWEKSFGPFEILKVISGQDCFLGGKIWSAAASDEPPSVLAAPALTTDGYGHALGTWIHDDSNHPLRNQGELYAAYFDGATWHDPASVAGSASLLVTDPAVAFVGPAEAVAVYATNAPIDSDPYTMTVVNNQLANQKILDDVDPISFWGRSPWACRHGR